MASSIPPPSITCVSDWSAAFSGMLLYHPDATRLTGNHPPSRTLPLPGLAAGAQPELALTHAESKVIAQTVNRTRGVDAAGPAAEGTPPPARGVSHSFDSLEATQRLAVLTGTAAAALSATKTTPASMTATAPSTIEVGPTPAAGPLSAAAQAQERQTATQAIGSIPRPTGRAGWRRRDWLLVGGAALAGLVIAGTLIKRRD